MRRISEIYKKIKHICYYVLFCFSWSRFVEKILFLDMMMHCIYYWNGNSWNDKKKCLENTFALWYLFASFSLLRNTVWKRKTNIILRFSWGLLKFCISRMEPNIKLFWLRIFFQIWDKIMFAITKLNVSSEIAKFTVYQNLTNDKMMKRNAWKILLLCDTFLFSLVF